MIKMIKKILVSLLLLPIVILLSGLTYQAIGSFLDLANAKPPGELIDVDGHKMHIYCTGTGEPTVILDAAADGTTAYWGWIQSDLSEKTRVCSYDRPGHGWSQRSTSSQTAGQIAMDLKLLLKEANIEGPYIFVGHSFGTNVGRIYREQNPDDVVGMVFIDPPPLHPTIPIPASFLEGAKGDQWIMENGELMAYFGFFRLKNLFGSPTPTLPSKEDTEYRKFYASPELWKSLREGSNVSEETFEQVRNIKDMGDVPLLVISAGQPQNEMRREWTEVNKQIATLSTKGEHHIFQDATHGSLVLEETNAKEISDMVLEKFLP